MQGKVIIFSAPSGAGKTTILKHLLSNHKFEFNLVFSISATNRKKRNDEIDGEDYYFLSTDDFLQKIKNNEFLEYEEVYKGHFYGTLKAEIERLSKQGKNVLFDVDVNGGLNIKKKYGNKALLIFIMPPDLQELERRLRIRYTESEESIIERIAKAKKEIALKNQFDKIIINDELHKALIETDKIVREFLKV